MMATKPRTRRVSRPRVRLAQFRERDPWTLIKGWPPEEGAPRLRATVSSHYSANKVKMVTFRVWRPRAAAASRAR